MNNSSGRNNKSIGSTILILVVAGVYIAARPWLERKLGVDLPGGDPPQVAQNDNEDTDSDIPAIVIPDNPRSGSSDTGTEPNSKGAQSNSGVLTKVGRDWHSKAGLIYGGGRRETRRAHVLKHAKNDTSKPVHGVFTDGDPNAVFALVDEAYKKVKSRSPDVTPSKSGDKMTYTVLMGRQVGYKGGRHGKRQPLKKIKLVLVEDNHVITAFPY